MQTTTKDDDIHNPGTADSATNANMYENVCNDDNNENSNEENRGIWIGIDLGTSNSACAVWDSTRGSPKWIRLEDIATPEIKTGKSGRLVPSLVELFGSTDKKEKVTRNDDDTPFPRVGAQVSLSNKDTISSAKRLLGTHNIHSGDTSLATGTKEKDNKFLASLPYQVETVEGDNGQVKQIIRLSNGNTTTPDEVLRILLQAIRLAAQTYLDKYTKKKRLKVPGGPTLVEHDGNKKNGQRGGGREEEEHPLIRHVVVGVPANFSKQAKLRVEKAARNAGFDGVVQTCLESTAAAMAYGLTLQGTSSKLGHQDNKPSASTIMVVDMGGGTTDITIATKNSIQNNKNGTGDADGDDVINAHKSYKVLITQGDSQLGGDDIDFAMMEYCLSQISSPSPLSSWSKNDELRRACRKAKEALCDLDSPSEKECIPMNDAQQQSVVITQEHFEIILQPWLQRAKDLVQNTLEQLENYNDINYNDSTDYSPAQISEVILVGGTTRIPAIRRMIQSFFPKSSNGSNNGDGDDSSSPSYLELCTSLNPMPSVAQGLAIQAALCSKVVPIHEIKSALMLDCIPHAIGVELPNQAGFVEIIPRNTPLPARGTATFTLADIHQPGVTIRAVEQVGPTTFVPMATEDFTFLLKRLDGIGMNSSNSIKKYRTIEVGMMVDNQGQFIVSVFDENDPEQVRKRERLLARNKDGNNVSNSNDNIVGELEYIIDLMRVESGVTTEQFLLSGMLIAVIILYIAVKLAFSEPSDGTTII